MRTRLWHKTRLGKFRADRKGFSSIIGAIFMVIIVWILASGYFIYTLAENTVYNDALRGRNQFESDALSENVRVTNTTYWIYADYKVNVSASIINMGPLSVQLPTLWAYASNATYAGYNFTTLSNLNVQGGAISQLSANVTVAGLLPTGAYSLASWLVTGRGNVVPLQKMALVSNLPVAGTAQGIGSIAFDFAQFWHYDFVGTPSQGAVLPSPSRKNYTISSGNYTVHHVSLTDLDLLGHDIVLEGNSSIYIIGQHSGTVKYDLWSLVNVTNGKIYPSSVAKYSLQYGVKTEIYFAGSLSGQIDTNNLYPLNIDLSGTKGNNDYGQNIPFVAIYLVP